MLRDASFQGGPTTIHYVTGPTAPRTVVFLHGVTAWWQSFLPILPSVMVRYGVIAADLPGHGRSGRCEHGYTVEAMSDALIPWLRDTCDAPVALYGHSLGALLALWIAAHAGDPIDAVIVEDPPLSGWSSDRSRLAAAEGYVRGLRDFLEDLPVTEADRRSALASLLASDDGADNRAYLQALSALDPKVLDAMIEQTVYGNMEARDVLERVSQPLLVLRGEVGLGSLVFDDDVAVVRATAADVSVTSIAGAGHFPHRNRPTEVARAVMDFLETV